MLIGRMMMLGWKYRWGCVRLLALQGLLLLTAIACLRLTGLGIDVVRFHAVPGAPPPSFPWWVQLFQTKSPMAQVAVIAAMVLVFELVRGALNYIYTLSAGYLVHARIVVDLRSAVYEKMQQLSFGFFDSNATGSIINRVTSDVQSVRAFVDGVLIQLVILLISLVGYVSYMSSIHVGLTVACLATTPLMWVVTAIFSYLTRPAYDRNRVLVDEVILNLAEYVQGVQVIKGFGREREEVKRFEHANREVQQQQHGIFWMVSLFGPSIGYMTQINLVILLAYGGWLVTQNQLALGSGLVVFAGLLQQFSSQVANLTNIANSVQQSLSGARRVFEVLDTPSSVRESDHPIDLPQVRGKIELANVSFAYPTGGTVLRNLDLVIEPGERIAILGATGSGKSSLLSLIARFYDPTTGTVLIDGHDARNLGLKQLRRQIGIVFQETFLFSNTVAANIAYGHPDATMDDVIRAAQVAAAHEFIVNLPNGYQTILGEGGFDLSGGQRQRLAIARAVLLDPAILLLDDPAAAIDPHTEHEILDAMQQAMEGRTTIVVAHRLSTLRSCDAVIVLDYGEIVQRGTHDSLFLEEGHYRDAATAQLSQASLLH